ncbi:MAG: UMP kinase [Lentisphaerae bacterium]|nr:UMP kinase [Lentisphaerota bacterium]
MTRPAKPQSRYKRVLLKLSGEAFQDAARGLSIAPDVVDAIAARLKRVHALGVDVALVVGGGNIFRGVSGQSRGIDRTIGDYMGMLATLINALALQDALERAGLDTRIQTAIEMNKVAEPFILRRALHHFAKGRLLIFAAGTGNPYFSTDTAAALRASEIQADVLLKATKVNGVYAEDPRVNPKARRYRTLTYQDALKRNLRVMDGAAFSLCMENKIPIIVFNFFETGSLRKALTGKPIGTLVH